MKKPYSPKAIRGQAFPGFIKVSTAQVKKLLDAGQSVRGFMVGNKVSAFHFFGGWHLAHTFEESSVTDFETRLNSFHFYLAPELGSRAALYIRRPYRLRPFTLWTDSRYARKTAPWSKIPISLLNLQPYSTMNATQSPDTITYTLPAYWASYLINGDASGLDGRERAECDAFLASENQPYFVSCSDYPEFCHRNDAGTLPGDCLEYTAFPRGSRLNP